MILMVIGIFVSFLQLITSVTVAGILLALFMAFLDVYFFICVYSLYDLFRNERLHGRVTTAQPYGTTVVYAEPPTVYAPQNQLPYPPQQQYQQPKQPYDQAASAPVISPAN